MSLPPDSGVRILVVDDDPAQRETLADILSLDGCAVDTAGDGASARAAAGETDPAVAIVDLRLPDTDGLVLSKELRERLPNLQVVVLTGHASVETAAAAVRAETADYLVKPVNPDELRSVVSRAADRWRAAEIEGQLRRDHERFRQLLDGLTEIVTVVSAAGEIRFESGAVVPILHCTPSERIGTRMVDWVHPDDRERFEEFKSRWSRADSEACRVEVRMQRNENDYRMLEVSANGGLAGVDAAGLVLTSRDVTDQKRLEAELRQSQKMEAIGQLTGGIAHEINNVLTVVMANGQSVAKELGGAPDEVRRDISDLLDVAQHGAVLVGKLLGFSRQQRLSKRTIDVAEAVDRCLNMVRRMIPATIDVERVTGERPCHALADDGAVEQIVMNLVTNARDAMPDGGTLTVRTGHTDLDESFCSARPGATPGWYVRISVTDTGCGIAAADLEHVFEPFFTTKLGRGGTGLGMAMIFGLVKQHHGYADVRSVVGEGTTVDIYLPAKQAPADRPAGPASAGGGVSASGETILIVEDQPALMRTAQRILVRAGFNVLTAGNGYEALEVMEQHTGVDLVLTDVIMPNMSGRELANALLERDPGTNVLFMSGYSAEELGRGELLDSELPLLQKPWTVEELIQGVRDALGSSPAASDARS